MKIYDIVFVGFGPSVIFSLLKNFEEGTNKKILVLEKGKSIAERDSKECLFGSGGAGAYSDSKLVANPLVGGDINDICSMSDEVFYKLADDILYYYQKYIPIIDNSGYSVLEWKPEDPYQIKSYVLKLLKSKVCHVGTDNSKGVFSNIEWHIKTKICELNFEEEVEKITPTTTLSVLDDKIVEKIFVIKTNKENYSASYLTKKVVIGVGKRSSLVTDLVKQLELKSKNNLIQIGIRVETTNKYLKVLIDKFYDFKVVMNTELGRWRTFCVCAKDAYVAVEKNEDFVSCNGAANASNGDSGLINFGIMGELKLDLNREEQVKLMQEVNGSGKKLIAQNINDFLLMRESQNLRIKSSVPREQYRLDNLWNYYSEEVCKELELFILAFQAHFDLEGHFFAPEIKLTNPIIEMNDKFEIYPGIHLIGDCSGYTRSIVQAGITGMIVGEYLNDKNN